MDRLKGKVAIVTGAAKGLGAADARVFVAEGAQVIITDVDDAAGSGSVKPLAKTLEKRRLCLRSRRGGRRSLNRHLRGRLSSGLRQQLQLLEFFHFGIVGHYSSPA
jgi:NAD(P)-dependent dehydrogenase (short-subunit alcohol dehydrogenase family)